MSVERDEYNVLSYVLLTVCRAGQAQNSVFSAERYDRLRGRHAASRS